MKRPETIRLATQLLSDLETADTPVENVVNKGYRLAVLVGHDKAAANLLGESIGHNTANADTHNWLQLTYRWDGKSDQGTFAPAATVEELVKNARDAVSVIKLHVPQGDWAASHSQHQLKTLSGYQTTILTLTKILSSVRAGIYRYASAVLSEAQFASTSVEIFESYRAEIDRRLSVEAAEAFEKLPAVFERLDAGSPEAISHALTSCRRIIDAFADSVFPPVPEPVPVRGEPLDCGPGKTKNRLKAFIERSGATRGQFDRLNRNLGALYERVSAGVHADVSPAEAQALVLNTYLVLGEIVGLRPG